MSHVITKPTALIALGLLAFAAAASAEDLELKVEANRTQVYLGESFILNVTLSGSSHPAAPDLSRLRNCSIKPLGSRDISNYSITIINGRMMKEGFSGRISSYEITPTVAGKLQVGPISVTVDGRPLSEPGPVVTVTDIKKQDRVIISVTSSRDTALIDEPFDITLRILIRRLEGSFANIDPLFTDNPPDLSAPYLSGEGLTGLTAPDLRRILQDRLVSDRNQPGLAINNLTLAPDPFDFNSLFGNMTGQSRKAKFMLNRRLVEQDGLSFIEYSLTLTFTPRDENNYVFGPVVFKGAVPVEVDAQGKARGAPVFAVGPACTVRIVPPPEEGRPSLFTGALGTNLTAAASLDAVAGNVGDPLKLTLTLSGEIRFDKMLPPKLSLQTNIVQHFTVYDNTVQTVKRDNQRQYIYTLRPNHAGAFDLAPIEIPFYDTQERRYKTVSTLPIPLQVKRGTEVTASHVIGNTNHLQERKKESSMVETTPAAIRHGTDGANPGALMGRPWTLAAGAAGPTVYLLVILAGLVQQHRGQWKRARQRRHALNHALRHMRAVNRLARHDPARAGQAIRTAICCFMADRLDAPASGLTPADVRQYLEPAGISPDTIQAVILIFERYFNAGFSHQSQANDLAEDCITTQKLMKTIDRECR
ncbi:MAG: BatD family protein [Verrucomicrobia bacterium]|nr:BatD family protein [Verrucomicrobiota bacterium]MCG2681677.1 BatD family protein [Kiritimatiellia bacterium]MBU4247417.1 BatD family protein [Verrucomicrobiota bacterium]MBU4290955.1 BatD family protein [Verrucomicrobiota bacterium]MBU4428893.1 BatD family protein [Verrucomicrobiota bacterium]